MFKQSHRKILRKFLFGLLCCLGIISISHAQYKDSSGVIGVRAPVWTEELGDVPLDKYTEKERAQMVRDFWTPERMRNATPMELRSSPEHLRENLFKQSFDFKKSTKIVLSLPASIETKNITKTRNKAQIISKNPNGKIFAYDPISEKLLYCSGSSINSDSKRIVATAAHCVHNASDNTWYSNWYFLPDYFWGMIPYGGFAAAVFWVPPEWVNQESFHHGNNSDVAFVTTHANYQNLRVVEAVGGHGITHGGGYNFDATIIGYPEIHEDGQQMFSCSVSTAQRWRDGYAFVSTNWCNFSEGASGGPWLEQYDPISKEGVLRGISSWIQCWHSGSLCYNVRNLNSPYFSSAIINLFNSANSADW